MILKLLMNLILMLLSFWNIILMKFIPLIILIILKVKKMKDFCPKCFIINLLTFLMKKHFQALNYPMKNKTKINNFS